MAVSFLKKASSVMPSKSLTYRLHHHLAGMYDDRSTKVVHASDVTKEDGFCGRYFGLSDLMGNPKGKRYLNTAQKHTFNMGEDAADRLCHTFADMGIAIGHWKCMACNYVHLFQKRPPKCEQCACRGMKHEEVRFRSKVNGVDCGVDLLVNNGDPKLTPVEIKTMKDEEFKGLIMPKSEHRTRGRAYLRIIDESEQAYAKLVSTSRLVIIYLAKGYGKDDGVKLKGWGLKEKFSPFAEFDITRDDASIEAYMAEAQEVHDFRAGKAGLPGGICPTATHKRATMCPRKHECFSGQYPAGMMAPKKVSDDE